MGETNGKRGEICNQRYGGGRLRPLNKTKVYLLCCAIVFLACVLTVVAVLVFNGDDEPSVAHTQLVTVTRNTQACFLGPIGCSVLMHHCVIDGEHIMSVDETSLSCDRPGSLVVVSVENQGCMMSATQMGWMYTMCTLEVQLPTTDLPTPTPGAFSTGHVANWTYTGPAAESFELRASTASWTVAYSATARSSVWTGRGIPVGRHMLQIRTVGNGTSTISSGWVNLGYVTVLANPGNPGLNLPLGASTPLNISKDLILYYNRFKW